MKRKIGKGIYRDDSGAAIRVHVHGQAREFRKDEQGRRYGTYTDAELRMERKRVQAREQLKGDRQQAKGDTLAADVDRYLTMLTGRSREDADHLLQHWIVPFGDRARRTLTAIELRQHAATWTCAASTFNHRRQALVSLSKALDGPEAPNPARQIPKRQEPQHAPKALPYEVIRKVLKAMPAGPDKARLTLMAYTGLPHMQIGKLTREDWQGTRLRVTPRRKGAGAAGRWIPLAPEAVAALKQFDQYACWGPFSRYAVYALWKAYGPKGTSPYSLRHSWITELYRRSNGDVLALQQLALHSRLDQTQRYAAAALEDRMAALVLPRSATTVDRGKVSKTGQKRPPQQGRKSRGSPRRKRQNA